MQDSIAITYDRVIRGVARAPNFAEELSYLAGEDALVLQAAKEVVLRFFARRVQADLRGHQLREELGELAQLQQRSVRVVRKVALRKHAQTHELFVVHSEVCKVRARSTFKLRHLRLLLNACPTNAWGSNLGPRQTTDRALADRPKPCLRRLPPKGVSQVRLFLPQTVP